MVRTRKNQVDKKMKQFFAKLTAIAEARINRKHQFRKGILTTLAVFIIVIGSTTFTHWEEVQRTTQALLGEVASLRTAIEDMNQHETLVTATMYKPHPAYTDSTPDELADGTKINIYRVQEYRYVALSRDLLKRWGGPFDYGDFIVVENAGDHSGVWQVKDTMAERWVYRLDFLMPLGSPPFKYESVTIRKQNHKKILAELKS